MFRLVRTHETSNCIKNKFALHISKIKYRCERCKSYYQALGLDSTATAKDIKAAYYKLSLKFHPDKNKGSEESVAKFREITEAYEVLGNAEKKRKYDQESYFEPNYSSRYSEAGKFYRSSNHHGPYTGRSKDFNYDEHFKRHYEDYQKRREIEYEYFKRRWEADFNRRYKNFDDYYQNRDKKSEETFEKFSQRITLRKSPYPVIFALWTSIFLLYVYQAINNPDNYRTRPEPLYYKVSSEDNDSEDKQN